MKAADWVGFLEQNPGKLGKGKKKEESYFYNKYKCGTQGSLKGLVRRFTGADI